MKRDQNVNVLICHLKFRASSSQNCDCAALTSGYINLLYKVNNRYISILSAKQLHKEFCTYCTPKTDFRR